MNKKSDESKAAKKPVLRDLPPRKDPKGGAALEFTWNKKGKPTPTGE
jgi:hypothetical protein